MRLGTAPLIAAAAASFGAMDRGISGFRFHARGCGGPPVLWACDCEAAAAVSVCTAASCTGIWGFACLCWLLLHGPGGQAALRLAVPHMAVSQALRPCPVAVIASCPRGQCRAERRARAPASRFRATGAMPFASLLAIICCGDS